MRGFPRWTYLVLAVCALGLSVFFLVGGLRGEFTTGTIVRVIVFALAGIIWLWEFRKGQREKNETGAKPSSPHSGTETKG
jgi:uncharacterized membrane protein YuzA (DUF378 family)